MNNKLTYLIPTKNEPYNQRLVANVTQTQKSFVQEMSKKFGNESEFVRFMLDKFIQDVNLKEGV